MEEDLVDDRDDTSRLEENLEVVDLEVGYSDRLNETLRL